MKFQDTRNYRVNSDKARTELGWYPHWSIDDGIIEVKDLIEKKRIKDISSPRYTNQAYLNEFANGFINGESCTTQSMSSMAG